MSPDTRPLAIALIAVVLLAGCSGAGLGDSADAGGGGSDEEAQTATAAATEAASDGSASDQALQARQRAVIKTGTVSLRVESFDAAREALVAAAKSRGGYVASSSAQTHRDENRTWTEGTLVLKVPSDSFGAVFRDVKTVGEVRSSNSDSRDVTDKLVDLEARLKNLRAQRDRLRTLYEEANDTEAVLKVGARLSEVQGRIERLEAKKRALEGRVAYATITVRFDESPPPEPTPTPAPAYHDTALGSAFLASVDGVVVSLKTLAVTAAYVAPYLVVFGVPMVGLAVAVRRRRSLSLPGRGGGGE